MFLTLVGLRRATTSEDDIPQSLRILSSLSPTTNVCETLQMFCNYSAVDDVVVVLVVVETFYTQEGESLNLNPVTGGVEIIGNEDLVVL